MAVPNLVKLRAPSGVIIVHTRDCEYRRAEGLLP